jgi:hypothetical protein
MLLLLGLLLLQGSVHANTAPDSVSIFERHKPFGVVLRTVRDSVHMIDDTSYQTLQVETTASKRFSKIMVRFGVYQHGKRLFFDQWPAESYFEARDKLADTVKWRRLEYLMKTFFINQNFTSSGDEPLDSVLARTAAAEIAPASAQAREFDASPHRIFSVYGGRDHLYAITWLESKRRFVKVWKN